MDAGAVWRTDAFDSTTIGVTTHMHRNLNTRRRPAAAAVALLLLAGLLLAACGGSTSTSTTGAGAATQSAAVTPSTTPGSGAHTGTTPGTPSTAPSYLRKRFAALRECMARNGVKLPQPKPGQARPFLGGPLLPAGVSRSQYEAALRKCGGPRRGSRARSLHSAAVHRALARFAACMRANGVNVPPPNTSGTGPIFNTKGIDTKSPQFVSAASKCEGNLRQSFPDRPAGPGTPAPGTATPTTPGH
jgi:hypothetical protein